MSDVPGAGVPATTAEGSGVPASVGGVLEFARERRVAADRAETEILQAAVVWAGMHTTSDVAEASVFLTPGSEVVVPIAGEGAPLMLDHAETEFAAMLGMRSDAGKRLIGEAVELCFRLPRLWRQVQSGRCPAWRARRIAGRTIDLCPEAAAYVDRHLGLTAAKVTLAQVDNLVDQARAMFDPVTAQETAQPCWDTRHVTVHDYQISFEGTIQLTAELDLADALDLQEALKTGAQAIKDAGSEEAIDARRSMALGNLARGDIGTGPHVTVYAHVNATAFTATCESARDKGLEFARLEAPDRLLLASQVAAWCGRPDARVTVKPVIDLAEQISTTAYEIPARLREQVILRDGRCLFPFCSRSARRADLDHVLPFNHQHPDQGGQTESANLGALCRKHHRVKTHTRWRSEMPSPGVMIWTSPHGHRFRCDHTGTTPLGPEKPRPRRPNVGARERYHGHDDLDLLVCPPPGADPATEAAYQRPGLSLLGGRDPDDLHPSDFYDPEGAELFALTTAKAPVCAWGDAHEPAPF